MSQKDADKAQDSITALDADGDGHLTKEEIDQQVRSGNTKAKEVQDRLTAMFKKYDKDGDGTISKTELRNVLMAIGNKKGQQNKNSITEIELEYAFMHADRNNDGRIDVSEFISWVTGSDSSGKEGIIRSQAQAQLGHKEKELRGPERFFYDKKSYTGVHTKGGPSMMDDSHDLRDQVGGSARGSAPRTQTGAPTQKHPSTSDQDPSPSRARETEAERHERLAKESAVSEGGDEIEWSGVQNKFTTFAGKDMDGGEFAKICRDCNLFDKKFKSPDADMIFAKVCEKGKRRINMEQFKTALRMVAAKKGCSTREVQYAVAGGEKVLTGTVAEANKFYDDKSLWTGVAAEGGPSTIDDQHTLKDLTRQNLGPKQ